MCRATDCENCGLRTWIGCGKHIDMALSGVSLEKRCSGWETGQCKGGNINKDNTPMSEQIELNLRNHFGSDIYFLDVQDVSGGSGSKFLVIIVLVKGFDGVKLLERHRMVNGTNGALADVMEKIHALEMKTWTKEQYEAKQSK